MKNLTPLGIGMLLLMLLAGSGACTRYVTYGNAAAIADGKYDTAFPFGGNSEQLKGILDAVRLLNATVYYERYTFEGRDQIRKADIAPSLLRSGKYPKTVFNDFRVGTATLIDFNLNRMAVMTCAHVVDFPDTIITFYAQEGELAEEERLIYQVAFKKKVEYFIADIRQGDSFDVLAADRKLDIAILGKEFLLPPAERLPVFRYPLGSAKELDWGNLLYIVGFPSGKKMITTGIVSSPDRNRNHDFLLDALFNRGFSGGVALAIRDGVPNFELVGIVNAVAADNEIVLVPGEMKHEPDFTTNLYYEGPIYAGMRKKINYGISFGISIESIRDFIQEHRRTLENRGFHIKDFFGGQL